MLSLAWWLGVFIIQSMSKSFGRYSYLANLRHSSGLSSSWQPMIWRRVKRLATHLIRSQLTTNRILWKTFTIMSWKISVRGTSLVILMHKKVEETIRSVFLCTSECSWSSDDMPTLSLFWVSSTTSRFKPLSSPSASVRATFWRPDMRHLPSYSTIRKRSSRPTATA